MKNYVEFNEWNIIENGFHLGKNKIYESFMSLGNGYMGMRGNFEEDFSGDTLLGTYVAGVYYPDKTRVGWWKNGYPEYFAKVLNAINFRGIKISIDGEILDLAKAKKVKDFKRILNMKDGYLERNFIIVSKNDHETKVSVKRFLSIDTKEIGAISYSITPLNYDGKIEFTPYLDGNVTNEDSNYDEIFWDKVSEKVAPLYGEVTMVTKKTAYTVTCAMTYSTLIDGEEINVVPETVIKDKYVANTFNVSIKQNSTVTLNKYIALTNNRYLELSELSSKANKLVLNAKNIGFEKLLKTNSDKWHKQWEESDIVIEGDISAQQAIRFNIFHLYQTYTGEDSRLNIGPKGFTGEKYGGSTYWDTEAYCVPFYLSTAPEEISKQLLIYRYNQLDKAKENSAKLGTKGALYPMVTMTGEECHNEWEITFEELHRNSAIAYAIFNYVRYTGDEKHLISYGFPVLTEISRFWASRVNYNTFKDKYMILGVTGPNEYENNVNNNWHTNRMASWTLEYTLEVNKLLGEKYPTEYAELVSSLGLKEEELSKWQDIITKMYYPRIEELDIFAQQDGYMDKEQILVSELNTSNLPLNQKWSWDRILRSGFIKQADTLQGIFFLSHLYDKEFKKKHFDFYEPRTVHESSLSPCVHCILASEIGYETKAYEMYLRTARLDLDNYNNDSDDGLHITSMAGTWMSVVYGFGGLKVMDNMIEFNPFIPKSWNKYAFKTLYRGHLLNITVSKENVSIELQAGDNLTLSVYGTQYTVKQSKPLTLATKKATV
ncbi:maltose phosphorylase [Clostridium cavendishii DSM 21758]|uniref:Maltose phosphorylase n=1 Tax=Clostridium cavendishii DSM 21758 TaxID=1121302 RepID=A0A1M6BGG0_9CLOT|nr:family 65 glycosyl hydrolase domain-containing protein [Clostridium cavendishii]SHI47870.1 maltose phosphorylase [Clostridium cavendishii DSM 21758]